MNPLKQLQIAVLLTLTCSQLAKAYSGPETLEEAIAQVKAITNPNLQVQAEMRARKTMELVRARVSVLNNGWGTFLQGIPIDIWNGFSKWGSFKTRSEALAALREKKGVDSSVAAWILGGGQCAEHAGLVQHILNKAGVPTTTLTSSAPHDFPVVNLSPHAVADIPWTWGKNFIVADSWSGEIITDPAVVWRHSTFFNSGKYYVFSGKNKEGAMRETLAFFVQRGKEWVETGRCALYDKMYFKYMMIPVAERPDPNYPPDNYCNVGWVGTWRSDPKQSSGPTMSLTFKKTDGVLSAKAMDVPVTIKSISDTAFEGTVTMAGELGKYDFWLTKTGRGTAQGKWRFTTAVAKDFNDFPWNAVLSQN